MSDDVTRIFKRFFLTPEQLWTSIKILHAKKYSLNVSLEHFLNNCFRDLYQLERIILNPYFAFDRRNYTRAREMHRCVEKLFLIMLNYRIHLATDRITAWNITESPEVVIKLRHELFLLNAVYFCGAMTRVWFKRYLHHNDSKFPETQRKE